jgi:broad specificity phosphatase PhoE
MAKLILIKHAKPLVDPTKSSEQWKLSEEGRKQCEVLADAIAEHAPSVIFSSTEPKAVETAAILGQRLGVPCESAGDLGEHDRSNVPHMRSGEFISNIELLFRRPDEQILGRESADEALARFDYAVDTAIKAHLDANIAIVSHGTVIALLVEKYSDRDGFLTWREMGLPSFAVFEIPAKKLVEVRNRV